MSPSPDDKWNFVLEEIRGLRREQGEARNANSTENKEIRAEVSGLRVDLEKLKEKSRLWGSIFGAGGGIAAAIVAKIIKHT